MTTKTNKSKEIIMTTKTKRKDLFFLFLLSATLWIFSCNSSKSSRTLTIASKNYTENIVLSHVIAEWIKANSDIEINLKSNLGTTFVVWQATKSGDIDIYPDYTGTIYQAILKKEKKVSKDESLRIVQQEMQKKFKVRVFDPFGFNNTYAISMLETKADKLGITKISDLRNHLDLVAGFDSEFIARTNDGSAPMFAAYGFKPEKPVLQLEIGLKYQAIIEGHADYTDAYSTDAKLKRFKMKVLEDDLAFFPPYYAVPVVSQSALERFPNLKNILARLAGSIDEEQMITMNYDVEELKQEPQQVAIRFLKSKGLLRD